MKGRQQRHAGRALSGVVGDTPLPDEFARLAHQWLGDDAAAFLAACATPPGLAVRANALKGGLPALLPALGAEAAAWSCVPWWPTALLPPADQRGRLASGIAAGIGALYAQDAAALAAVAVLDPRPGERTGSGRGGQCQSTV